MLFTAIIHRAASLRRQAGKAARALVAGLAVSATGLVGYAVHEGFVAPAYQDSGGVWTIGFGETAGVKPGQVTTPVRALVQLLKSVEKHADGVRACLPGVSLFQWEFDAFVKLAYNIGVAAFCGSSIPGKLAAGDFAAACRTILDFDKFRDRAKPKVLNPRTGQMEHPLVRLPGLTNRRQAEFTMCMGTAGVPR